MTFKQICARADVVDSLEDRFTEKALKDISGQQGIPVLWDFDNEKPIGTAGIEYVEGRGLVCTVVLKDRKYLEPDQIAKFKKMKMACSGKIRRTSVDTLSLRVIESFKPISIGFVVENTDHGIPEIGDPLDE